MMKWAVRSHHIKAVDLAEFAEIAKIVDVAMPRTVFAFL
jgi:hypothetical protein